MPRHKPLITPLTLGNVSFPINIIQGPLAGVSCAPFRALTWKHGQPAFSCTEMISCKTLLHSAPALIERYTKKDPHEGPVCFQLSGNDPVELAEATKIATALGADLIDLNCGCPVNKIRSKGAGSKLLSDPSKLYQLIRAMKTNTHVPVSIKIRVQGGSDEAFNADIAKVVADAAADFLVVHGRHWTEHYEIPCHHEQIQFFVEQVPQPVIGNGDVSSLVSLKKMFATGVAGVMIGRAGVGQPWLIRKLIAEMQQESFQPPSSTEIGLMFIDHITQLAQLLGSETFAVLQARKLAKYYARDLAARAEFVQAINATASFVEFTQHCLNYFND